MVERGNIYKMQYDGYTHPTKFVVLYVTDRLVTIMHLNHQDDPVIGTNAAINRIETRKLTWFYNNNAVLDGRMKRSEYMKILHLMTDLFSGVLKYSQENRQYYYSKNDLVNNQELADTADTDSEESAAENESSIQEEDSLEEDSEESENSDSEKEINSGSVSSPLYDIMSSINENSSNSYRRSSGTAKRKSQDMKNDFSEYYRKFTLDEVETIALSNANIVSSRFNVPNRLAYVMIRNAKEIVGMADVSDRKWSNSYVSYFEDGYDDQKIAELTGRPIWLIKQCRTKWELNSNASLENVETCEKHLQDLSIAELAKDIEIPVAKFATKYNISYDNARSIIINTRQNILAKNIYYLAFGAVVFNEEDFKSEIEFGQKAMQYKNRYNSNKLYAYIYSKLSAIRTIYEKTFDDHSKIISGELPIPLDLPRNQVSLFMSALTKRFSGSPRTLKLMCELDSVKKYANMGDVANTALYMLEPDYSNVKRAILRAGVPTDQFIMNFDL